MSFEMEDVSKKCKTLGLSEGIGDFCCVIIFSSDLKSITIIWSSTKLKYFQLSFDSNGLQKYIDKKYEKKKTKK